MDSPCRTRMMYWGRLFLRRREAARDRRKPTSAIAHSSAPDCHTRTPPSAAAATAAVTATVLSLAPMARVNLVHRDAMVAGHTHTQAQAQQSSGTRRMCAPGVRRATAARVLRDQVWLGHAVGTNPPKRAPPSRHHRCRVPSSYFVTEGVRHNARSHSSTYLAVSTQRSTSIWRRSPTAHTSSTCV